MPLVLQVSVFQPLAAQSALLRLLLLRLAFMTSLVTSDSSPLSGILTTFHSWPIQTEASLQDYYKASAGLANTIPFPIVCSYLLFIVSW